MFSTLLSDLRVAMRSARRQPAFTAVVVGTLALGIGSTTAMFALIHAALLKPLPYDDPGRLVLARRTVDSSVLMWNSAPDYYDYRAQTGAFQSLAAAGSGSVKVTVTGGERPERVAATRVSHDLFRTLGVAPAAGRWFTADEGKAGAPFVVMISERLARRHFGDAGAAIGRSLVLVGVAPQDLPATIVGVMPATYRFLDEVDLWAAIREGEEDGPVTRQFHNWVLVARLKPGVSIETAQSQVDVVSKRLQQLYPATNKNKALRLDPLQSALFERQTPRLMLLMGAVGLVLLIACANVAGLLLARGAARRSEFAVRAALGASRARIAGQLVTESVFLAVTAGFAGIALSVWLQRLLPIATGLADRGVTASGLEWPVLLFALAASVATGLLFGAAPAVRASSLRLVENLAPGARATDSRSGTRLRSALVVAQVAVSLALLVGAGLLIQSLTRLARTDLGFDARQVLTGQIQAPYPDTERRLQFFEGLRDDLLAMPGVTAVSFTSHVPVRDTAGDPPMWAAERPPVDSSQEQTAALRIVLPGYFETLRIPLVAGRDLAPTDRDGAPRVLVVNQVMARTLFPGESPLGKKVMVATGTEPVALEVVGVVGDARIYGVGQPAPMTMYATAAQLPRGMGLNLMVRTSLAPTSLVGTVRKLAAARNPDVPVESLVGLDELIGESLAADRVIAITLSAFSAAALLLASLGLYGVLSYYVTQRTHEIGVRMALGANARTVLTHVLARSAFMVVPGLALGLGVSLAGSRMIERLLYDVRPTDPLSLAAAVVSLAVVAFLASALPAWRAARIDPVQALRGE
ncbi:MAG: ABC transporter permease [Rhodospirillaceae bacterium]